MPSRRLMRGGPRRGAAARAVTGLAIVGAGALSACGDSGSAPGGGGGGSSPGSTWQIVDAQTTSTVDTIDILLAIDNSSSMGDKQEVLALAIPDLVEGLVNPPCVDAAGAAPPRRVPSPADACPEGFRRAFEPIKDIHVGVISSSLGGHGGSACSDSQIPSVMDMGHLLARSSETVTENDLETFRGKGFLAWDPDQKLDGKPGSPGAEDGEADLDDAAEAANPDGDLNTTSLVGQLTNMVKGVGQTGCGYEAQLESVYRFLVDPEPYETITVEDGVVVTKGIDETIRRQRRDFLRPSSLLAILLISDENDCSVREEANGYTMAEVKDSFRLWKPRAECATDPNDPCCRSCRDDPGDCPPDPSCLDPEGLPAKLTAEEDPLNVRCWDQKRRFGTDFLYPIERYVQAFTEPRVQTRGGELVDNPLFQDLDPDDGDGRVRDPGLVLFAGIIGVPWQDIARQNAQGEPDLVGGLDRRGNPVGGFKDAAELGDPVMEGAAGSTWDLILGDPATQRKPADPFMIESSLPREGENPITGDRIVGPSEEGYNAINGREWTTGSEITGDLQYACTFPIAPRNCEGERQPCDCRAPADAPIDNPLCAPADGNDPAAPAPRTTTQIAAKAYPGLRELQLIKELGPQGIVGSVCPKQLDDASAPDYGYRPAISAILARLSAQVDTGSSCSPSALGLDEAGRVSCVVLEARREPGACSCDGAGRAPVAEDHAAARQLVLDDPRADDAGWNCVCEVEQLAGEALKACQYDAGDAPATSAGPAHGWCYVDPAGGVGNPEIVAGCPTDAPRLVRFVNQGEIRFGATSFLLCSEP